MNLKQKLGLGLASLGLVGAISFGIDQYRDNTRLADLETQKASEAEIIQARNDSMKSGVPYTLSIGLIGVGLGLYLYPPGMKK